MSKYFRIKTQIFIIKTDNYMIVPYFWGSLIFLFMFIVIVNISFGCFDFHYKRYKQWCSSNCYYLTQFLKFSETDKGIFSQLNVEEQIVKLNKGLEHVETLICNQVFKNHEELLNQVTWIENLESIINNIASQLQNLQSSVELLKSKIVELYAKVQTQVVILNRLHTTCDLLRKIMRIQNLSSNALGKENTLSQNIIFEIT
ncbi:conserved oligomeric Golgi complex subunit 5-like isoform X2 [Daktulosphaira vitifoliae]|uniref:conserved oligomeric Golgi complex subunit 5-like isoform X2 n=1 Tax=Daktulosphaira vitifoliae TaxID=58002 RepID=UPI0021AA27F6|nr:conserved oligomeric Golgi complex subunit 5-like isoform X2 [Daktulosphaira vitifoliae]